MYRQYQESGLRAIGLCAVCLVLALGMASVAEAETKPRFSWATFYFFWNKNAVLGSEIVSAEPVAGGYNVSFGYATAMFVQMEDDFVKEIHIRFGYTPEDGMTGRAFLRAQDSLLRVGMYRWPQDKADAVKERFSEMTPGRLVYAWRTSHFERQQLANGNWLLVLKFIDDAEQ